MSTDPKDLLIEAEKVPQKFTGPLASQYVAVLEVLRGKGLTWKEIVKWFDERGLDFSEGTLQSVWHKHVHRGNGHQ